MKNDLWVCSKTFLIYQKKGKNKIERTCTPEIVKSPDQDFVMRSLLAFRYMYTQQTAEIAKLKQLRQEQPRKRIHRLLFILARARFGGAIFTKHGGKLSR